MKRKTSNTDLRAISKDEQEIVRGYVLFRPLYRPNITIAKTIPFIGAYLCIIGGIVFWKGWMIGIIGGLIILLVLARVILIKLIELYQHYAPENVRRNCLLKPTCSEYAILAIKQYGALIGMIKTIHRLFHTCRGYTYHIDEP
mgnify:FL=1